MLRYNLKIMYGFFTPLFRINPQHSNSSGTQISMKMKCHCYLGPIQDPHHSNANGNEDEMLLLPSTNSHHLHLQRTRGRKIFITDVQTEKSKNSFGIIFKFGFIECEFGYLSGRSEKSVCKMRQQFVTVIWEHIKLVRHTHVGNLLSKAQNVNIYEDKHVFTAVVYRHHFSLVIPNSHDIHQHSF